MTLLKCSNAYHLCLYRRISTIVEIDQIACTNITLANHERALEPKQLHILPAGRVD